MCEARTSDPWIHTLYMAMHLDNAKDSEPHGQGWDVLELARNQGDMIDWLSCHWMKLAFVPRSYNFVERTYEGILYFEECFILSFAFSSGKAVYKDSESMYSYLLPFFSTVNNLRIVCCNGNAFEVISLLCNSRRYNMLMTIGSIIQII